MTKLFRSVSLLLLISASISEVFSQPTYQHEIKQAATTFINSLSSLQKKSTVLSFNDTSRVKWNNLPVGMRARAGINIGKLSDDQRKLLHRILSVSLSSQGYLKATSVMHLDNLLNMYYDSLLYKKAIDESLHERMRSLQWSHNNFFLAFFGSPSEPNWGYKIEGHHLSINFTFTGNKLSITPWFIGTDPAEFPITEYAGWRVLGQEQDLGIKLINLLSAVQQKKATLSGDVPADIITAAESGKRLIDYAGLPATEMSHEQQLLLQYIVREFVFNFEYTKAVTEYDRMMSAGIGKIYFAWIGPYDEAKPHYFVLNGPTFLIEFDNSGPNKQGNHIHAIWREKGNEYGEDVLKKHYQTEKH